MAVVETIKDIYLNVTMLTFLDYFWSKTNITFYFSFTNKLAIAGKRNIAPNILSKNIKVSNIPISAWNFDKASIFLDFINVLDLYHCYLISEGSIDE